MKPEETKQRLRLVLMDVLTLARTLGEPYVAIFIQHALDALDEPDGQNTPSRRTH